MRADVCLRRSAAAIAAAADEDVAEPIQATASGGRGVIPNPFAALLAPAHTVLSDERIHFDPVPVFVGPAPGWKGPALGARGVGVATASVPAQGDAESNPPPTPHRAIGKSKSKRIRNAPAEAKTQKLLAAKAVKPKTDNSGDVK